LICSTSRGRIQSMDLLFGDMADGGGELEVVILLDLWNITPDGE